VGVPGYFDWNWLASSNVDVVQLFGPDAEAISNLTEATLEAARELTDPDLTRTTGKAIYNMTFEDYRDGLRDAYPTDRVGGTDQ
jgi:hypothetical protein